MTDAAKKILAQIDELPEEEQRWLTEVLVVRRRDADGGLELSDECGRRSFAAPSRSSAPR